MNLTERSTGFDWGPARITRLCDDPKHGVWLMIAGAKQSVEVRVTNGGRLRVGRIRKTDDIFKPTHTQ